MTLFTPGIWSRIIQAQVSSQDSHLHIIVICITNAFSVTTSDPVLRVGSLILIHELVLGSPNLFLEGWCPAEFSSNLPRRF